MRCKTCDYTLWEIRDRKCPECGTPFKPSEYEFALNSVQFCCPHCEQDYYGTGPKGELVPRTFACVRCARTIDMDDMILRPTQGVREEQTEGPRQPWLEWGTRRKLPSAFFATVGHALVMPGRLMRATPAEGGAGKATGFMALALGAVVLVYAAMFLVFFGIMAGLMTGAFGGPSGPTIPTRGPMLIASMAPAGMMLVFYAIALLCTLLVSHGILKITGGCAHGIGRTWQALCYSSGANVVSAVPCLGMYFGWIWWLVSACVAVKEAQRVHGGRAALAVLAFPLGGIATLITVYVIAVTSALSGAGAWNSYSGAASQRMSSIATAFKSSSKPVRHAMELVQPGALSELDLMEPTDMSGGGLAARMKKVPIGGTDLDTFQTLPTQDQNRHVRLAVNAMNANTIAYRLGDTVFTHCGIDPTKLPPGAGTLWVAVDWPESLSATTPSGRMIHVACANGTVPMYPANTMPGVLQQQNSLRAQFGLPPLPHPGAVTHTSPALADTPPALKAPAPAPPVPDDSP